MVITLFDKNIDLCNEMKKAFEGFKDIEIMHCDLEALPSHDFLITAGNSFGAMSSGIDLAVRNMFGYEFQDILQLGIMEKFPYGVPIGELLIVPSLKEECILNSVIYLPTMRTPSLARALDIMYTMALVVAFSLERPESTFAIPGLGTGCGELLPDVAAKAMRAGYDAAIFMKE